MELNLRPMTEAERLYCYGQSQQIMAQTGCVGHLRADMDTDGRGFFSSWDDHIGYLKTQEFKDEFEVVIDSLRFDSGVLANRTAVQKFCAAHPEAQITPDRPDYGFRTDTVQYAYTGEKTEVPAMFFRKRDKVVLTLTPQEARYARSILLRWRNKLLNAGKPTEDVEELILRLAR